MKKLCCFFIVLFSSVGAVCAQAPKFYCVRVTDLGRVELVFTAVSEGADFTGYLIDRWNDATAEFDNIAMLNDRTATIYTDNAVNASTRVYKYRIRHGDVSSECETMLLRYQTDPDDPLSVQLTWTSPGDDVLSEKQGKYNVYRLSGVNTDWVRIGSTDSLTYTDGLPVSCKDTASYMIELLSRSLDRSVSSRVSLPFGDAEPPGVPQINGVRVDPVSQKITLHWTRPADEDTKGYQILKGDPALVADSISDPAQTTYTFADESAQEVHRFSLVAFDRCHNTGLRTPLYNNLVLSIVHEDCAPNINLSWNEYTLGENFKYRLYVKKDNEVFQAAREFNPGTTFFDYPVEEGVKQYSFYLEAQSNSGHLGVSNIGSVSVAEMPMVEYIHIRSLNVSDDNREVDITAYLDSVLVVGGYDIFRIEAGNIAEAEKIARIPYNGKGHFSYKDRLPEKADQVNYSYFIAAPDACNLGYKKSDVVSIMPLSLDVAADESKITVTWQAYDGWDKVNTYEIYRKRTLSEPWKHLASVNGGQTFYDDVVIGDKEFKADKTYYKVIATEGGVPPDGIVSRSSSMVAILKNESVIFIPNAFCPRNPEPGLSTFRPQCNYIKDGTYLFKVFSRNGDVLFETTDPDHGWDGTHNGEICPIGTYVYYVECKLSSGLLYQKGGVVNIVE